MMKLLFNVRALVLFNTFWLLFTTSCSPNFFLVLLTNGGSRSLDVLTSSFAALDHEIDHRHVDQDLTFHKKFPGVPVCNDTDKIDVTLVTQTSMERLHVMKDICDRWTGPLSIVVAGSNLTYPELYANLTEYGCRHHDVTATVYPEHFKRKKYPVNVMRNMALRQAKTSHALYLDIDLIPSKHLYENILYHKVQLRRNPKDALVVPAFQLNPTPECEEDEALVSEECSEILHQLLPETKEQLLQHYGHPFDEPEPRIYQFTGRECYYGHSTTGYEDWAVQEPFHSVEPIECLRSVRYEPYLVVRLCDDLPPYQEQFSGYGKNKISWMWQMQRSGYRLFRLGSGFTIHYPHPNSKSKRSWAKTKKAIGRENLDVERIAAAFRAFLQAQVPDQGTLPYCERYESSFFHEDPPQEQQL